MEFIFFAIFIFLTTFILFTTFIFFTHLLNILLRPFKYTTAASCTTCVGGYRHHFLVHRVQAHLLELAGLDLDVVPRLLGEGIFKPPDQQVGQRRDRPSWCGLNYSKPRTSIVC